jgi:hypothetical protein
MRTTATLLAVLLLLIPATARAQTSQPGPEIDVEIVNPSHGGNTFRVIPGATFWAYVFLRPGDQSLSCQLDCGQGAVTVPGGTANIATALIDVEFDSQMLEYLEAENNPMTAAVDGLIQERRVADGRVGWALAGDWTPDATATSGTLASPCDMARLDTADWLYRIQFRARPEVTGETALHLRRESDDPAFELSFADLCGSAAFKQSAATVDEVIDATVTIAARDRTRAGGARREPGEP